MKNLTLIIAILLFCLSQIFAQDRPDLAVTNISAELLEGADAVIRYESGIFAVEDSGTATEIRKMEITRLNKQAISEELYIGYDMHTKVGKIKVELYDALGNQIRKIKKDDIVDNALNTGSMYSDARYKSIDLTQSTFPYTVVYEYEIQHNHLMGYPKEYYLRATKTSSQEWDYTLKVPLEVGADYRVFNSDLVPVDTQIEGLRVLKFSEKNIKPIKVEPLMPNANDVFPYISFIPKKFKVEGYEGDMSTWKTYGTFLAELNKNHNNPSAELIAEIKNITAGVATTAEKIDIIYKYVQENMRYVSVQLGIGGWQSFDAAYVEKNKYGDCKALSYYTKSLLEVVGITAYPVLVESGDENTTMSHPIDFSYPDFDHMILTVPSEDIWMECTQNFYPTNYLGSFTDNRSVLLITEEGGKLSRTPAIPIEKNAVTRKVDIQLYEDGSAKIVNSSLLTGPQQENIRYFEKNYSNEELEKWFLYTTSLPSCEIKKLEIQADRNRPKGLLDYEVEVRKYGSKGGKRMFVPANCVSPFEDVPDAIESRQHPVVVKRGYMESDEIMLHLPEGYEVESITEASVELTSEFGEYSMQIKTNAEAGELIYHRKLKILPVDLPAERFSDLREFYLQIAKADKMKLVLVEKRT